MINYTSVVDAPGAYITKSKNRLKQFGNTVHLENNDEFELELFNPKLSSILIKIKLNGNYISTSGLMLRPGQRIYLERYIDTNNKFKYTTYDIDGDSIAAKNAITNNGLVEIEVYDEQQVNWCIMTTGSYNNSVTIPVNNYFMRTSLTDNIGSSGTLCNSNSGISSLTTSTGYNKQATPTISGNVNLPKSIETGRVEMGDSSNQNMSYANGNFNSYTSNIIIWKILPLSQKPVESKDLKKFCTECGTTIKNNNDNFCSSCGHKLK